MKSEIFNEYAKLAAELGWIDKKAKDSPKDIEDLYNVKPFEGDNEDDETLMQKAHPNGGLVMSPAYDPINGMMMTPYEQQNLMSQVATNPPNGNYTQVPWVQRGDILKNILVRMAFKLDSEGEEDLMALADSCLGDLVKDGDLKKKGEFTKNALWANIGRLALSVVLPGVVDYFRHGKTIKDINQLPKPNYGERLELKSAIQGQKSAAKSLGRGAFKWGGVGLLLYSIMQQINPISEGIVNDLNTANEDLAKTLDDVADQSIIKEIMARNNEYKIKSQKWLAQRSSILSTARSLSKGFKGVEKNKSIIAQLDAHAKQFKADTEEFVEGVDSDIFILEQMERKESGWMKELRPLKTVVRMISKHDIDDAIKSLTTAKEAANKLVETYKETQNQLENILSNQYRTVQNLLTKDMG